MKQEASLHAVRLSESLWRGLSVWWLYSDYCFHIYQSDPSGNYNGCKATVIGTNSQAGKSLLNTDYNNVAIMIIKEALELAVQVLNNTM